MKYSLRSLMIVVTMICVGLTVWTRYQSDCDGIVPLNGKPAHSCSMSFWRVNGSELLEKYRDLMKGISSLDFLAGFCYTQLTDIEQEINGLLTYDRKPKVDPEAIAAIHAELFRKFS